MSQVGTRIKKVGLLWCMGERCGIQIEGMEQRRKGEASPNGERENRLGEMFS